MNALKSLFCNGQASHYFVHIAYFTKQDFIVMVSNLSPKWNSPVDSAESLHLNFNTGDPVQRTLW